MASGPAERFDAAIPGAGPGDSSHASHAPSGRVPGQRRTKAARGIVVNTAFLIGLSAVGFVKGFGVAAFLTPRDYGVWGLLAVTFVTLYGLVQVGVDDKYIQQEQDDQEVAFQEAFTMQCLLCAAFVVLIGAVLPLYAMAYGDWRLIAPGYVLLLVIPATAFQVPLWAFYRDMDYLTQRRLQIFDPITGFVVTIGLAALGTGYWSLVLGVVAGGWAAAVAAIRASPWPLRLRYRRGTLRDYWTFSGPLLYSAVLVVIVGQVPVLVARHSIGLVGVGAIAVAGNISQYANHVDDIVTNTLYPAVCAVKDRADLLLESFLKSNRLAMLWATPFGAGAALFGPDVVAHVLGHRWDAATYAIQSLGVAAAINQVGFNWTAFYRALGQTRPIAVSATVMCVAVLAVVVPLLATEGIAGYGTGTGIAITAVVVTRLLYLARLFPLRAILVNCLWGALPSLPAVGAVLGLRLANWGGTRTTADVIAEVAVFGMAVIVATLLSERQLIREFRGYLRRGALPPRPIGES